jgi:hypothetical protein
MTPFSISVRKCKTDKKEQALDGIRRMIGSASSSATCIVTDMKLSDIKQVTGGIRPDLAES